MPLPEPMWAVASMERSTARSYLLRHDGSRERQPGHHFPRRRGARRGRRRHRQAAENAVPLAPQQHAGQREEPVQQAVSKTVTGDATSIMRHGSLPSRCHSVGVRFARQSAQHNASLVHLLTGCAHGREPRPHCNDCATSAASWGLRSSFISDSQKRGQSCSRIFTDVRRVFRHLLSLTCPAIGCSDVTQRTPVRIHERLGAEVLARICGGCHRAHALLSLFIGQTQVISGTCRCACP